MTFREAIEHIDILAGEKDLDIESMGRTISISLRELEGNERVLLVCHALRVAFLFGNKKGMSKKKKEIISIIENL